MGVLGAGVATAGRVAVALVGSFAVRVGVVFKGAGFARGVVGACGVLGRRETGLRMVLVDADAMGLDTTGLDSAGAGVGARRRGVASWSRRGVGGGMEISKGKKLQDEVGKNVSKQRTIMGSNGGRA